MNNFHSSRKFYDLNFVFKRWVMHRINYQFDLPSSPAAERKSLTKCFAIHRAKLLERSEFWKKCVWQLSWWLICIIRMRILGTATAYISSHFGFGMFNSDGCMCGRRRIINLKNRHKNVNFWIWCISTTWARKGPLMGLSFDNSFFLRALVFRFVLASLLIYFIQLTNASPPWIAFWIENFRI